MLTKSRSQIIGHTDIQDVLVGICCDVDIIIVRAECLHLTITLTDPSLRSG